jgi:hypothetical protein
VWLNRHDAPRYYPNAVTLTPGGTAAQLAAVAELAAARASFAVKDSFAALDLSAMGFNVLFEAVWLWRDAAPEFEDQAPTAKADALNWQVVTDAAALGRWEAAWAGLDEGQSVAAAERVFRPPLLAEPGVALLAGVRGGRVVAVAAANRTGEVVGLSNVFASAADPGTCWAGVVRFLGELYPGRPLVGYERGDDLAHALDAGFRAVGALRVWAR